MSRIDKSKIPSTPANQTPSLELQLADRTQAISAGGLPPITQMIKTLDLRYHINSGVSIFKVDTPYDEADYVLNIALNLLADDTCLDHFEIRRTHEADLNALGAQRIPAATAVGDFCRRFDEMKILMLMQAINKARHQVWKLQPEEFFERAIIAMCRAAGFKEIFLRGETDFALTTEFDRWDDEGVKFIFGYDPKPNFVDIAESPENDDWKPPRRRHSEERKTASAGERSFEEYSYFFYIANESNARCSSRQVVFGANDRCDQENTISQLHAYGALAAPHDNLTSNGAYMGIASLAWSLECWSGLMIRPEGTAKQKQQ